MQIRHTAIGLLSVTVLLAACAPKPDPIMPEPVYDKYGAAIITEQSCRPAQQSINANYPERLPLCECDPGQELSTQSIAAGRPQCGPIRDEGGNDDPQQPRGQNGPNIQG